MPSVCFYFQVHQPFRLRKASYHDFQQNHLYFDDQANGAIMRKVAEKCYLPTNKLIKHLIEKTEGKFRVAFSITGVAVEQMQLYAPEVLESFVELADTGCVEFIGETYYHSLAAIYDKQEFLDQVRMHSKMIESVFGQKPTVFRNTELIYDDYIGSLAAEAGFKGIIAEGVDDVLGWRSPNFVYSVKDHDCRLLLKNYRLSDDIAFRFSNREWKEFPLTADKFSDWVHKVSGAGDTVNLFMDYETFGEHQWSSTGIFEFMRYLPEMILKHPDWNFATPSEVIERYPSRSDMHFHRTTSWADMERDLTAWRGNRMQNSSLEQIYSLGKYVRLMEDLTALGIWRKLLTSDHFYYMCTKWFADGDVHAYFSPYESPYEAFVTFMNAFKDFKEYFTDQALSRTFL
jgi:alpha-amylase